MEMTGAEAIVRCLERAGVEYVFGLCGHANVSVLDALIESPIKFISVRHEQDAAHMADAYYRFAHKPAVVLTSIGPGLANALTGIMEADLDSSAVILLCGNVPSYMLGREAFQELATHGDGAQAEIYRPVARRTWRIADHRSIPYVMQRAFNFALAGRPGPVVVDVPINYFSEVGEFVIPEILRHLPTGQRVRGDQREIERAVSLLCNSERPLIHAGYGTILSEASEQLVALAEYLNVPVTTTMTAQGAIDPGHRLAAGTPGAVGTLSANTLSNEADVVLALGTRFSELETSSWDPDYSFQFERGAKLIQVDLDPHEIGKAYPVEVGIVGDVGAVLSDMLDAARALGAPRPAEPTAWVRRLQQLRATWQIEKDQLADSGETPLRIQRVFKTLAEVIPDQTILLVDAGTFRHAVPHYVPIRHPRTWFMPGGLCTMGGATPAAVGAKIARPDHTVVCLVGDGGFAASDHALATAVETGIAVVWVVLNNSAFDSIRTYQHAYYDHRVHGTDFRDPSGKPWSPDFVQIAAGYGVAGRHVETPEELAPALTEAIEANAPYLVEVAVGPTFLKSYGHWDIADFMRQEAAFKRRRGTATTNRFLAENA